VRAGAVVVLEDETGAVVEGETVVCEEGQEGGQDGKEGKRDLPWFLIVQPVMVRSVEDETSKASLRVSERVSIPRFDAGRKGEENETDVLCPRSSSSPCEQSTVMLQFVVQGDVSTKRSNDAD
jgi:hypothetical protein